ncbi:MAG: AraC family transcriptional regulator [Verrucomicrobiota bacterium]
MRIIRSNQTWRVVESFSGVNHCLERLAFRKGYRVADVCNALGCSSRYLHTLFVRDIGLPPKHWMNLERMVVARRKLEGGKPPEVVSKELGFMSVHTFYRQFQKFHHTTPPQFQSDRRIFDPVNDTGAEWSDRFRNRSRSK